MIVVDDEDDQTIQKLREDRAGVAGPSTSQLAPVPVPTTRLLDPRPTGEPDFEAPPAYPGTGYQTFPQPPPRPYPISQDSLPPPASAENKRSPESSTWRRFVQALVVALILYALISALRALFSGRQDNTPWDGREWPKLPDERYEVAECSTFYNLGEEAYTLEKALFAAEDGLFFVTTGDQAVGSVHFVYDGSLRNAQAQIQTRDMDGEQQSLLSQTKICILQAGKTQGVGISTPSKRLGSKPLNFTVTLSLPYTSSSYSRPHGIRSLRSSTSNFAHTLVVPKDRYFVQDVDFKTTNRAIVSGSIAASSVSLHTTNALIAGEFNVNKLLSLETRNGDIQSHVIATNDPRLDNEETKIELVSSNSPINGVLNFKSLGSDGKGGKFRVEATTTNNPVTLTNEALPLDAVLNVAARSKNSPVNVHLAPAFEGAFALVTTNQGAIVRQVNDVDPAHYNRKRSVTVSTTGKKTTGFASWSRDGSDSEQGKGSVSIASTNGPVSLYV